MDGGTSGSSNWPSSMAGSCVSPPNITCDILPSCSSAARFSVGWLYPWTAHHHDDIPSTSVSPLSRVMVAPSACFTLYTGSGLVVEVYGCHRCSLSNCEPQNRYPASSISTLSSDTFEPSVVSRSPTMAELMPMCSACFTASLLSCERPPAKRRKAVGLMKRKRAMVVSISSSLSGACRSSGVPGMGLRRLMGMDCTSSSRSVKANSMRCSMLSPIPMMPPLQMSMPTLRAACRVRSFSSCVCVLHSWGK